MALSFSDFVVKSCSFLPAFEAKDGEKVLGIPRSEVGRARGGGRGIK